MKALSKYINNTLLVGMSFSPLTSMQGMTMALEEITVTATKRVESIQEIPISMQVITGDKMEAAGITEFEALSTLVPNFSVGDGLVTNNVIIRGVGSGNDRGFEQSVGMFIDGVYMPRSRQYRSPFLDVERVEILRGPQAVLYGLNSTAGSINISTKTNRPGDEFEASLMGEYEALYDSYLARAIIGGAVGDNFAMRLVAQTSDSGDGTEKNAVTGRNSNVHEQDLVRLTTVYEPLENLSLKLKYEHVNFKTEGNYGEAITRDGNPIDFGAWIVDGKANHQQSYDDTLISLLTIYDTDQDSAGSEQSSNNIALKVNYDFNDGNTLTVTGAYSKFKYDSGTDIQNNGLALLQGYIFEDYEQSSLEVQYSSPADQVVDYIIGAYYQQSNLHGASGLALNGSLLGLGPVAFLGDSRLLVDQDMFSVYGHAIWNINTGVRLIGGLRYVDEAKEVDRPATCQRINLNGTGLVDIPGFPSLCSEAADYKNDRSSNNWMPEIALQYDFTEDIMLYTKVSKSVKSGGFAASVTAPPSNIEFDDETATGFEMGMKSTLADGTVQLNVALFIIDYKDLQLTSFVDSGGAVPTAAVSNAGKAKSQGVELDVRWAANEGLTLGGSMGWLDAEYEEFSNGPCSRTHTVTTGESVCDLAGRELPLAPNLTASVFAEGEFNLGNGINLVSGVDLSWSQDYFVDFNLEPNIKQNAWAKLDVRIGLASQDNKWSVSIIGQNLTDETIAAGGNNIANSHDIVYLMAPRTIKLRGIVKF